MYVLFISEGSIFPYFIDINNSNKKIQMHYLRPFIWSCIQYNTNKTRGAFPSIIHFLTYDQNEPLEQMLP